MVVDLTLQLHSSPLYLSIVQVEVVASAAVTMAGLKWASRSHPLQDFVYTSRHEKLS
jgi:hypothetical protein